MPKHPRAKRRATSQSASAKSPKKARAASDSHAGPERSQKKSGSTPSSPLLWPPPSRKKHPRRINPAILTSVAPDSIEITRLQWNNVIENNPEFDKGAKQNGSFYLQPTGNLTVSFSLWKGLLPYTEAILVAYVEDGALAPNHFPLTLPGSNSFVNGSVDLSGWPAPFSPGLYGYHRAFLELWAVSPSGQPLPPQSQTNPPDPRLFVLESTDWVWLYISPGCRSSQPAGLDWVNLTTTFLSTAVNLDSTGTKVAPGQSVSFQYQITSAGFAPTSYGYNGSVLGLVIGRLGYDALYPDYPGQIGPNGTYKVDLSGLPFSGSGAVTVYAAGTVCHSAVATQTITGTKVPPKPAALQIINDDWTTDDGLPVRPQSAFTVHFLIQNVGGSNTGPFDCLITADDGSDSGVIPVSSLVPGESADVWWKIPGLDSGIYNFEITVDINHQVQAVSPTVGMQILI
jgi:hypothetical protein